MSDGIREETEAFMFFIEKGSIITPNSTKYIPQKDRNLNKTYEYNIYESSGIIWIHGPNDIPKTEFVFWHKGNSTKYESSFVWNINEPDGNVSMELHSIHVKRIQDASIYDFECSIKIHCDSHTASAGYITNDILYI